MDIKTKLIKNIILFALIFYLVVIDIPYKVNANILHSQIEAIDWLCDKADEKWNEDVDGAYGCQCVDLVLAYYDYLVGYHEHGNAVDYGSNLLPNGWIRIYDSPCAGDIVVWGPKAKMTDSLFSTDYADSINGHIGIIWNVVDDNTINTIETNVGKNTYAEYYERSTSDVLCYIRPNFKYEQPLPTQFRDVKAGMWYVDAIKFVYDNGIIVGYDNKKFGPDDKLTRGMIVTILYRMEGSPNNDGISKFSDVSKNEYYAKAVKWAVNNGIIHGYDGTTKFGPNDNIIRQDLSVILKNYAGYNKKDLNYSNVVIGFKDYNLIDSYALSSMQWAIDKGVITGNDDGTLNPKGNATRAETSAMIQKYCYKVGK